MKYPIVKACFLIFPILLSARLTSSAQNLFDSTNTYRYAAYLYELRQFKLAIPELERLIYFNSSDSVSQARLYKSYWADQQYFNGLQSAKSFYPRAENVPAMVVPELARLLHKNNQTDSAIILLRSNLSISKENRLGHIATLYSLEADWKNAKLWMGQSSSQEFKNIHLLINKSESIRYKRKGLAALMSAVIPGSGKFYTRDWKDGIFSFIFVGTTTFQAVRGFNSNGVESIRGWIFGGMALGFYTGNIAGAYQAANQYNQKLDNELIDKIEKEYFR